MAVLFASVVSSACKAIPRKQTNRKRFAFVSDNLASNHTVPTVAKGRGRPTSPRGMTVANNEGSMT